MKTLKKLTVLAVVVLISATSLMAQQGRNYSKQEYRGQNQICNRIPDLTEDQQIKIEALKLDHVKEMTTLRNQTNELRAKKRTLMSSDADLKEVNAVIDQMTELQNKKMKLSAKHRMEIRELLTEEQKVYFDSQAGKRQGRGEGRHSGRRGGRGQGQGYGRCN